MSQLAINNLKTDDQIKNLNLKEGKRVCGGDIYIYYDDSWTIIYTPLEATFDFRS
jgi:hypothetical protein